MTFPSEYTAEIRDPSGLNATAATSFGSTGEVKISLPLTCCTPEQARRGFRSRGVSLGAERGRDDRQRVTLHHLTRVRAVELDGRQPKVLQPCDLALEGPLGRQIGEGGSPPQVEGLAEQWRRPIGLAVE